MARRSVLFSPGDEESLLKKAAKSNADVIVFDLEDAVAPNQKEIARETVKSVIKSLEPNRDYELCVRINPINNYGKEDVKELVLVKPDSIMLPKVESASTVNSVIELAGEHGWEPQILSLIETAAGVLSAESIAKQNHVDALLFGAEDLSADTGVQRTSAGNEISYARQHVVLAASAANIDAIDTLYTNFKDTDGLRTDTKKALQFGFDGKMAIHPQQIEIINGVFTPEPEQVEWAKKVVAAAEESNKADSGVFSVDGEMIDAPLIAQAESILERHNVEE